MHTAVGPVGAPEGGHHGGGADGANGVSAPGGGPTGAAGLGAAGPIGWGPLHATDIEIRTMATQELTHSWEEVVGGPIHLAHVSWAALREVFHNQMLDGQRMLEWVTPLLVRGSWEAGPYEAVSVELPPAEIERHEGPVTVYPLEGGRTRVVYGPWQVVVRGVDGTAESRILSRWHLQTSWIVEAGFARVVRELSPDAASSMDEAGDPFAPLMAGSSAALGASERMWLSASELRMAGGSEVYRLGASELLRRGASELIFGAASELRLGGSSELRWGYGSEQRLGGASELSFGSESRLGSASESRLGTTSESSQDEGWLGRSSSFLDALQDLPASGDR